MGHHVIDEPPFERGLGVDEVPRGTHLPGASDADRVREQHRQSPQRVHPDPGVGVGEPGPLRGDEEVAVERQLETRR
jgi:hypothetical protein